jgi:hypothetical protein
MRRQNRQQILEIVGNLEFGYAGRCFGVLAVLVAIQSLLPGRPGSEATLIRRR